MPDGVSGEAARAFDEPPTPAALPLSMASSGNAGASHPDEAAEEHAGVAAHDLRAVSARLTEQIEARLLRTRVVGGGKSAVYAGGDVVLEQANSIFGFCWWSDEVRGQKVIHLTS